MRVGSFYGGPLHRHLRALAPATNVNVPTLGPFGLEHVTYVRRVLVDVKDMAEYEVYVLESEDPDPNAVLAMLRELGVGPIN